MYESLRVVVFAVGAVQGIFLAVALLLKDTPNRAATRTLAAIVGLFTAVLTGELAGALIDSPALAWLPFVLINFELAIGPLLLFFVLAVFHPDRPGRSSDLAHLLPLAVGMTVWMTLYFHLRATESRPDLDPFQTLVPAFLVLKILYFFFYLGWTLRTLQIEIGATGRPGASLNWLGRWLIAFGATAAVLYALAFFNAFDLTAPIASDDYASFVLAAMTYLVSLMVLLRPAVFSVRPRRHGDRHAGDGRRLEAWIEREQPYLDPDLSLRDLADSMDLGANRLSTILNEGLGTTFYDLINRYRLAHFEELAGDPARRERTVLELAFESGFNSKASFYRCFRRAHGTTPTAFREKLLG